MEHILRLGPLLIPITAIIVGGVIVVVVLVLHQNELPKSNAVLTPTPRAGKSPIECYGDFATACEMSRVAITYHKVMKLHVAPRGI